jgi:hypothetical protein
MMTKLKEQVTKLVDFELEMANKQHGERFNSAHEAYAVMKEEYEEAKEALERAESFLDLSFWESCLRDGRNCAYFARFIESEAIKAACECIQVAAMAQKFINGEENT